ncbi:hypothetical protein K1719_009838 [Acacia pycnantha]|nr:hypothetical protein K1719_009838 [Acacia pycnantha]
MVEMKQNSCCGYSKAIICFSASKLPHESIRKFMEIYNSPPTDLVEISVLLQLLSFYSIVELTQVKVDPQIVANLLNQHDRSDETCDEHGHAFCGSHERI